jgi:hypothetical protein
MVKEGSPFVSTLGLGLNPTDISLRLKRPPGQPASTWIRFSSIAINATGLLFFLENLALSEQRSLQKRDFRRVNVLRSQRLLHLAIRDNLLP